MLDFKPTDATPSPWPVNGYAPGNYVCKCCMCKRQFEGDKRAVCCLECSVQDLKETLLKAREVLQNPVVPRGER